MTRIASARMIGLLAALAASLGGLAGCTREERPATPEAAFWQWFERNAARVAQDGLGSDREARDRLLRALSARLARVERGLEPLLAGEPDRGTRKFIVSAGGREELFPAVEALVAAAPTLPGWTIIAFKPRVQAGSYTSVKYKGHTVAAPDVWFRAARRADGIAEVTLYVRGLTVANYEARAGAAVVLVDYVLGEYDTVMKVDLLAAERLPEDPTALGLEPLLKLAEFVDGPRD